MPGVGTKDLPVARWSGGYHGAAQRHSAQGDLVDRELNFPLRHQEGHHGNLGAPAAKSDFARGWISPTYVFERKNRSADPCRCVHLPLDTTKRGEEMTMHFRITGLPAEQFAPLFDLPDDELAKRGAVRRIADGRTPGYPCRISLTDSRAGDELLLVNYEHHAVQSPYRMRFAIYVRRGEETYDAVDEVPEQLRARRWRSARSTPPE